MEIIFIRIWGGCLNGFGWTVIFGEMISSRIEMVMLMISDECFSEITTITPSCRCCHPVTHAISCRALFPTLNYWAGVLLHPPTHPPWHPNGLNNSKFRNDFCFTNDCCVCVCDCHVASFSPSTAHATVLGCIEREMLIIIICVGRLKLLHLIGENVLWKNEFSFSRLYSIGCISVACCCSSAVYE